MVKNSSAKHNLLNLQAKKRLDQPKYDKGEGSEQCYGTATTTATHTCRWWYSVLDCCRSYRGSTVM